MTRVPDGWQATTLGELGHYTNGRGFKKAEWSSTGRPIIRIQNLTGSSAAYNRFDGPIDDRHIVRSGDLLVSWAATLGAYFWQGEESVLNQHIFKVDSNIDPRFHKHLLDHKLSELMGQTHGSGMVHITRGRFDSLRVAVPPIEEQRRIVDVLEDQLSRLDAADCLVDAVLRRTNTMLESALQNAALLRGAPTVRLEEVLREPLSNGRSVPTREGGFPVLRLTALQPTRVDLAERKGGDWDAEGARRFRVSRDDIFVARGNGSLSLVGRGARVLDEPDSVAFPDTMIRIRLATHQMDPAFFMAVWNSRIVRQQLEAAARTTAGIYKVNQRDLTQITLPAPPLEDQHTIVNEINAVREAADGLTESAQDTMRRTSSLRKSILAAAFDGRLRSRESTHTTAPESTNV